MKLIPTKIILTQAEARLIESMESRGAAVADLIKTKDTFKECYQSAMPPQALEDPNVQHEVEQTDLIWGFDSSNNNQCRLIAGAPLLGYLKLRGIDHPISMLAFVYDSKLESVAKLAETVTTLKRAYQREHHIIKTLSDPFPIFALSVTDISCPKVQEKVAQADAFSVVNIHDKCEHHIFATRECKESQNNRAHQNLPDKTKFMAFFFDPDFDSMEAFVAALESIKGKHWQN